jgi:hypothetical protein
MVPWWKKGDTTSVLYIMPLVDEAALKTRASLKPGQVDERKKKQ